MSHPSSHETPHADGDEAHSAAVDAHEHDEVAPEEPKTPLWLTALGGGLFFLLAVAWLAGLASESSAAEAASAASASAAAAASAPPAPAPKTPPPLPPPSPPPIATPPAPIPPPPPPIPPPGGAKSIKKPAK